MSNILTTVKYSVLLSIITTFGMTKQNWLVCLPKFMIILSNLSINSKNQQSYPTKKSFNSIKYFILRFSSNISKMKSSNEVKRPFVIDQNQ